MKKRKIFSLDNHHLAMLKTLSIKYGSEVQAVRIAIEMLYRDYYFQKAEDLRVMKITNQDQKKGCE